MKSRTAVLRCDTALTATRAHATGRFRGRRADRGVRLPPRGTAVIAPAVTEPLERRRMLSVDPTVAARLEADGFAAMDWKGQEVYARPGRWIVRLDGLDGNPSRQLEAANAKLEGLGESLRATQHLGSDGLVVIDAPVTAAAPQLEQSLRRLPGFRSLEPDFAVWADDFTADPSRGDLWGLHNVGQTGTPDADIDAPEAWSVQKGSASVVVGVIDSGIDYTHTDLASNIWHNPGETSGNGVDDDHNGFVDDVYGWDFANNDNDPMDDNRHGTHVAGTIGADGANGIGVAGVNWTVRLMALKFLTASGSGDTANAIKAVNYAATMGVRVTSNSWGGGAASTELYNAIKNWGGLFVAAAGNNNQDGDASPHYPSSYDLPNILSVAATDSNDLRASFSNWGKTSVDVAAPGVGILSTTPGNTYQFLSGTSMATPHVSGVAALVMAQQSDLSTAQLKDRIMSSVDLVPSMAAITVSGGRLNARRAVGIADGDARAETPKDDSAPAAATPGAVSSTEGSLTLSWTATGDDYDPSTGSTGMAYAYDVRYSTADPATDPDWLSNAKVAQSEPGPGPAGTLEAVTITGLSPGTTYYTVVRVLDEGGNASATFLTPTSTAGRAWQTSVLDTAGDIGFYRSLAFDPAGKPALGYSDATKDDVKITRWTGTGWTTQVVDPGRGVASGIDVAFDPANGQPTLTYGSGAVKFARWTGSAWTLQTVEKSNAGGDVTSLAYDPVTKRPSVSYVYATKTSALKFAKWTGSTWQTQVVDPNAGARYNSLAYHPITGYPAIAYSADTDGDGGLDTLKFAEWDGTKWKLQSLDGGTRGYGVFASLAFDTSGNAIIVHNNSGAIRMLRRNVSSGAWTVHALDSGTDESLALAPSGTALVSYSSGGMLKLMRVSANGSWESQIVEPTTLGWATSVAVDSAGEPAVAYGDDTARDLKFAGKSTSKPGAAGAATSTAADANKVAADGLSLAGADPAADCVTAPAHDAASASVLAGRDGELTARARPADELLLDNSWVFA